MTLLRGVDRGAAQLPATRAAHHGRVVQVLIRSHVKSAWFQRFRLKYDELLSNLGFNLTCAPT